MVTDGSRPGKSGPWNGTISCLVDMVPRSMSPCNRLSGKAYPCQRVPPVANTMPELNPVKMLRCISMIDHASCRH
eukprot:12429599-Karenia_brevis.AAC.1